MIRCVFDPSCPEPRQIGAPGNLWDAAISAHGLGPHALLVVGGVAYRLSGFDPAKSRSPRDHMRVATGWMVDRDGFPKRIRATPVGLDQALGQLLAAVAVAPGIGADLRAEASRIAAHLAEAA